MISYDAIVLGLGGMGSAAAFHLASRGCRVLGLEQFTSPHARGSSHGDTRVIRQAYFEHPSYVPLLLRAYELWRNLEESTSQPLLLLPGGLMIGSSSSAVVQGSIRSAQTYNLPHELLDAHEIRRRFPPFRVEDDTVALFERTAGLVWCERSVSAHLDAAAKAGAELHFEEPVSGWQARDQAEGVTVTTGRGTYTARSLVITPGPWAPEILSELGLPLEVTRQVLFWFQPQGDIRTFSPDRFPIYIWQRDSTTEIYGFPAVDGPAGGVKVAFFHKPSHEPCTPATVDRSIRPDDEASLRGILREFLPSLDGPLVKATTCLYTTTPDHHFLIFQLPQHRQVSIACGFSGHGYKFCPVIGEILADLAMRGETRHDLALFTSRRF